MSVDNSLSDQSDPEVSHLKIFVTYDCNLRCPHCVQAHIAKRVKPADISTFMVHLDRFLASVKAYNPDINIYLSGGEPLLSPRFFQAARIIKQHDLSYKTITNGLLLERRLAGLLDAKPKGIWVTFNGVGSRHDAVVGFKGGFERVKKAVESSIPDLKRAEIQVGAVLVMNALTYDRVSHDVETIVTMGFDEVVLQHLSFLSDQVVEEHQTQYVERFGYDSSFCFGEGVDGSGVDPHKLSEQLQKSLQEEYPSELIIFPPIIEMEDLVDYYSDTPNFWKTRRCSRALHELWVQPDGSVSVCFSHNVGTIRQSIDQILRSTELTQWQAKFVDLKHPLPGCMRCHRLYM